jgi:predicted secreted protein
VAARGKISEPSRAGTTHMIIKLNQFSGQSWKMEGTNGSKLINRAGFFDSNDSWVLIYLHGKVAKGNSRPK